MMNPRFFLDYLVWHYTRGFWAVIELEKNLLRFIFNFFSISILLKTLFSPWRRLAEGYVAGLRPGEWLESFIVNSLMRLLGVIFRLILIVSGLIVLLVALAVSCLLILTWLLWPALILACLAGGLFLWFK